MKTGAASIAAGNIPALGSVFGFNFSFGHQNLTYPHPGVIVAASTGVRQGKICCGVIALAISLAEQKRDWHRPKTILIPSNERENMGLDASNQWVCLFEQKVAFFPDDVKSIAGVNSPFLGNASKEFTNFIIEEWQAYRKPR